MVRKRMGITAAPEKIVLKLFRVVMTVICTICLHVAPAPAPSAHANGAAQHASPAVAASRALIARVVPSAARSFVVETIPAADGGKDVFEIESATNGKIVLRGNNGVSIASALNWYLKYSCHCQVSWDGDNLALPRPLPRVAAKVRHVSLFRQRVDFNYCTFSYTMPWWDWSRWQREIDWMALHGINMPLAITGQEATWQATLRKFGLSDDEARQFLVGPAFFAWQWMTNIQSYGGPLPQSWIDRHVVLGQQILERERSLGMTPIQQGFTGCVPLAIMQKYPDAHIQKKPLWCVVGPGTAQLDPLDPLFAKMGNVFLAEQKRLFGTDHLYAADPFHEGTPPVKGDAYLTAVGKAIWDQTSDFDPRATIVMQTWSVRKPIVMGIPSDKILLLDLMGTKWRQEDGYWGRDWVAGIIHNYGGRVYLGGDLKAYAGNAFAVRSNPAAGHVTGIGLFPEGTQTNPIVYELASEIAWWDTAPDLNAWVPAYAQARYGKDLPSTRAAWKTLQGSVYALENDTPSMESPVCARPALKIVEAATNGGLDRRYKSNDVWVALTQLLAAKSELRSVDTYRFDVTDVARQALADLAIPLQQRVASDYRSGDTAALATDSHVYLDLIRDTDALLATRREFLLGRWIADARGWGTTPAEKDLYEWNARSQVTVWGPDNPNAFLFDYSNRQWAGLVGGFYEPRWSKFLAYLAQQPAAPDPARFTDKGLRESFGRPANNANSFYTDLDRWEYAWCDQHATYASAPVGDSVTAAETMLAKWRPVALSLIVDETKVGSWAPSQMSTAEKSVDWDVTKFVKAPGKYVFRVAYTRGAHALAVSEADLLRDGEVVATDVHEGWTGLDEYGQRYALLLPATNAAASGGTYTLRLHLRSDGGTDSYGDIYLARP